MFVWPRENVNLNFGCSWKKLFATNHSCIVVFYVLSMMLTFFVFCSQVCWSLLCVCLRTEYVSKYFLCWDFFLIKFMFSYLILWCKISLNCAVINHDNSVIRLIKKLYIARGYQMSYIVKISSLIFFSASNPFIYLKPILFRLILYYNIIFQRTFIISYVTFFLKKYP